LASLSTINSKWKNWKLGSTLAILAAVAVGSVATLNRAQGDGPAAPAAAPAKPAEKAPPVLAWNKALSSLNAGNAHFKLDEPVPVDFSAKRRGDLAPKQFPYAIIVTCSDSRVAPEHIFGASLGDLFVVRVAGNVVDPVTSASVEYAVDHLNCHLVVVMGHTKCGAVKSKIESLAPPKAAPEGAHHAEASENLGELLAHVHTGDVTDVAALGDAVRINTLWQAQALLENSALRRAYDNGQAHPNDDADGSHSAHFFTGVYDIATGEVKLEPVTAAEPAAKSDH
jgi:carbonic anhydrase